MNITSSGVFQIVHQSVSMKFQHGQFLGMTSRFLTPLARYFSASSSRTTYVQYSNKSWVMILSERWYDITYMPNVLPFSSVVICFFLGDYLGFHIIIPNSATFNLPAFCLILTYSNSLSFQPKASEKIEIVRF